MQVISELRFSATLGQELEVVAGAEHAVRRSRPDHSSARRYTGSLRVHFKPWCARYSVSGKRRVFGSGSFISALRLSASDTQVRVLECTIGGKIIL